MTTPDDSCEPTPLRARARRTLLIGYPYVEAARLRQRRTLPDDPFIWPGETSPGAPLNVIGRQRRLSDPTYRVGVGVNTDTLYCSAWLDLSVGPLVLELPRIENRYYSVQFAMAETSSAVSLGSRTHGDQVPPTLILGPNAAEVDPPGAVTIRSSTRYLNMPGRILVDPQDAADHQTVHQLQDQFRLRTLADYRAGSDRLAPTPPQIPLTPSEYDDLAITDPVRFLAELASVIASGTVSRADIDALGDLVPLGIDPDGAFHRPPAADMVAIDEGIEEGRNLIDAARSNLGQQAAGWSVNLRGPRFGDDMMLRAAVARDQIYVTIPEEGIYPVAHTDIAGRRLSGDHPVAFTLPDAADPPVDAFWSLTLYDDDGFLVPNPLDRYAISDRMPEVGDGPVEVYIAHEPPRDSRLWLPAPEGGYYLMMRLFHPREEALSGRWMPPGLIPADASR